MWNMSKGNNGMKDNRGVTLVEVLLAFAVSAIVLAAISAIIFTCLQMFGRTSANVEVQNEAQTAMSLLTDNIMDASGVCMNTPAAGANIDCMLLDNLIVKEQTGGGYEAFFSGSALVTDIDTLDANGRPFREIYLVEFPNDGYGVSYTDTETGKDYCELATGASTPEAAAQAALTKVKDYILDMDRSDRTMWLLSRYVTACRVEPARVDPAQTGFPEETVYYGDGSTEIIYYFKEPLTFRVSLAFESNYGNGDVAGNLEDEVSIRSRMKTVFINTGVNLGSGTAMREYRRKQ